MLGTLKAAVAQRLPRVQGSGSSLVRQVSERERWSALRRAIWGLPRDTRERIYHLAEKSLGADFSERAKELNRRVNEAGFDPFGYDPEVGKYALAFSGLLYKYYFRTEVEGIERLPKGGCLLVANHAGQVPLDGLMLGTALALEAQPPRLARSMVERWSGSIPFVSIWLPRTGQVVGTPDNARRLLRSGETLVVFPEGVRGISKPYQNRYALEEFGSGFMRLALETGAPVVPVAIIGAEEQYISLGNMKRLARVLGLPSLPLLPQLFVGMPLPLPTKVRICVGDALSFSGDPDESESAVRERVLDVQLRVQRMVDEGLAVRRSIFW